MAAGAVRVDRFVEDVLVLGDDRPRCGSEWATDEAVERRSHAPRAARKFAWPRWSRLVETDFERIDDPLAQPGQARLRQRGASFAFRLPPRVTLISARPGSTKRLGQRKRARGAQRLVDFRRLGVEPAGDSRDRRRARTLATSIVRLASASVMLRPRVSRFASTRREELFERRGDVAQLWRSRDRRPLAGWPRKARRSPRCALGQAARRARAAVTIDVLDRRELSFEL